ncbi:Flp pilus assembly surface protein TadF [Grimontia indica]|uniref:Flp pilus assembly surface protein TadF n=1 Tax=Grimontia indica TaxID=1056512 RepID=R1IDC1_9GAMM|nr:tight adherence pilus pseudopilin TadF [Grimontia indica]EOD78761.1 Flp pilus assembly surface protein TadF [Grimontia indica]
MTNLVNKQRGVFTIELVLVLIGFSLVLVFTMDVVVKQSIKGKLDRLSYSLVSLIKERTELFDGDETITYAEATKGLDLVSRSLKDTIGDFEASRLGLYIEQQQFDDNKQPISPVVNVHRFSLGQYACQPDTVLSNMIDMAPITQFDNKLTLYQVTICYRSKNWYGDIVGENFERVRSISMSFGR